MGQYLANEVGHAPHVLGGFFSCRGMVQLCYISWSAGVSCRTWSQMCQELILPQVPVE